MRIQLQAWFQGLAKQEQRLLLFGVPVIALLILYILLLQPLASGYLQRKTELAERRDDLVWLGEQMALLQRTNTACDPRGDIIDGARFAVDVPVLGQRYGLNLQVQRDGNSPAFMLTSNSALGDRALAFVQALACAGLEVQLLDLQTDEATPTYVRLSLRAQPAGGS